MKKYLVALCMAVLSFCSSYKEENKTYFIHQEFNKYSFVIYSTFPDRQIGARQLQSQSYDYAYRDRDSRYEKRYIIFSQIEQSKEIYRQVDLFSSEIVMNMAVEKDAIKNVYHMNESDMKRKFNADYSITYFVSGGKSDFADEYKYMVVTFVYKKDLGIICQAILYSDPILLANHTIDSISDSFRFKK